MFATMIENIELEQRVKQLENLLAESQRREKAAVEDILIAHDRGRCTVCKHMQNVEMCQKWPSRSCFEWRGVKGGGDGLI